MLITKSDLYCEDCIEGMPLHVEKGSVSVVVTSPPYNLGIKQHPAPEELPALVPEEDDGWGF
jgi:DNA modification methylase